MDKQSERVIEYYRRDAEDYDREYDVPFFKEIYDRLTWRCIEPFLPNRGVVLDAGGGTGKWSIPIAKKGLKVVIFDISQDMLNVASAKVKKSGLRDRVSFRQGDICSMPFGDDSFDFVLAEGDPISYCSDPNLAVKELGRVLKPNRYLSAGVDSYYYTLSRMLNQPEIDFDKFDKVRREKRFFAKDWGFDFWLFTPEDLKQLFKKHGFKVIKIAGKPVMFRSRPETAPLLKDPAKAQRLIDIESEFCEEASIVGYGGHLHIVAQKKA
jgi:ubiquinone/menaquinone biosynthesis C-methylase UbiE